MNRNNIIKLILIVSFVLVAFLIGYFVGVILYSLVALKSVVFNSSTLSAPAPFIIGTVLAVAALGVSLFILFKHKFFGLDSILTSNKKLKSRLFGESDWMTETEINDKYPLTRWRDIPTIENKQTGFLVQSKIDAKNYFAVNVIGNVHSLVIAKTRVGKTTRLISPNLQYWARLKNKPSFFVTDPKGELFEQNSYILQKNGFAVYKIDLRHPTTSHKYNPLDIVWEFYYKYKETNDQNFLDLCESNMREIANTICPIPANSKDSMWDIGGQNIVWGLLYAMLEDSLLPNSTMTRDKFTILQLSNILSQSMDLIKLFAMKRERSSLAKLRLNKYFNSKATDTADSFISVATNHLNQYTDSGMSLVTSTTEIDLNNIVSQPTAIFCIVPDDNTARHPLATLITSQIYKYLIYLADKESVKGQGQVLPRDFMFMLEEFGNFPKLDCIEQMLSIGGGRRIWTTIVLQSLSQLSRIYGEEAKKTLLNNLQLQIYMGCMEPETNKYFSEFFGSNTIAKTSVNLQATTLFKDITGSVAQEKQVLINPDELANIKTGHIVFKALSENPCKTTLEPIFDKDLKISRIWQLGQADLKMSENKFNRQERFYDLCERDELYDNQLNATLPPDDNSNTGKKQPDTYSPLDVPDTEEELFQIPDNESVSDDTVDEIVFAPSEFDYPDSDEKILHKNEDLIKIEQVDYLSFILERQNKKK